VAESIPGSRAPASVGGNVWRRLNRHKRVAWRRVSGCAGGGGDPSLSLSPFVVYHHPASVASHRARRHLRRVWWGHAGTAPGGRVQRRLEISGTPPLDATRGRHTSVRCGFYSSCGRLPDRDKNSGFVRHRRPALTDASAGHQRIRKGFQVIILLDYII
jgi:hypothetical protein